MNKAYTGQPTDREYYKFIEKCDLDDLVGYLKYYPNQGEKYIDGRYWGTYEGAYICFREPKCVASATTHLKRPESMGVEIDDNYNDPSIILIN
jgi:hypothetical protein